MRGYAKSGMAEIAEKADVSVGTLYNYFACKADLALAILADDRTIVAELENAAAMAADMPALERLLRFVEADVFHGSTELDCSVWAEIEAAALVNPVMRAQLEQMNVEIRSNLCGLLRSFQEDGALRPDMPVAAAADLLHLIGRAHYLRHVTDDVDAGAVSQSIRQQVAIVYAGLAASPVAQASDAAR